MEKSVGIANFQHILLRALQPIDIVVTKIGRLDDRDVQDIEACIKKFNISRRQIEERAATVHYVGNEEIYRNNLLCPGEISSIELPTKPRMKKRFVAHVLMKVGDFRFFPKNLYHVNKNAQLTGLVYEETEEGAKS